MSKANIGWLFYKKMYEKGDDDNHIKSTMNKLLKVNASDESMKAKQGFTLDTTYPGLLIGSGYMHGLSSDHDVKIGFYFDHTTGLPIIQGSSVKGMLRSCFGFSMENQSDPYAEQKHEYIKELMGKSDLDVKALAQEIFEGIDSESGKVKSIYERDIFYEARVLRTKGFLLRDDYLAPHGDNPLKNPVPLRFVKVAPEVSFEFSFDLKDSVLATGDEKEKLFLELLQEFGIGAKTNVGYGQFEVWDEDKFLMLKRKQEKRQSEKEKEGLDGFELFLKELEEFKKKDTNLVKKIKEYDGEWKDISRVKKIVENKKGDKKFHTRIMKFLDSLV